MKVLFLDFLGEWWSGRKRLKSQSGREHDDRRTRDRRHERRWARRADTVVVEANEVDERRRLAVAGDLLRRDDHRLVDDQRRLSLNDRKLVDGHIARS